MTTNQNKKLWGTALLSVAVFATAPPSAAGVALFGGPTLDANGDNGYDDTDAERYHSVATGLGVGNGEKYVIGDEIGDYAFSWGPAGVVDFQSLSQDPESAYDRVWAVNAAGIAVGESSYENVPNLSGSRAVRWDRAGNLQVLAPLGTDTGGYNDSAAYHLSDTGFAVGRSQVYDPAGNRTGYYAAVRWDAAGNPTQLDDITAADNAFQVISSAEVVNDAGVAVGYTEIYGTSFSDYRGRRAVRWVGTTATELLGLGTDPNGRTYNIANDLNNLGTAVGEAARYDDQGNYLDYRAVRWDPTSNNPVELEQLSFTSNGRANSYATAVNDAGFITGNAQLFDASDTGNIRAVRWDQSGNLLLLDALDPSLTQANRAYDINAAGLIVGWDEIDAGFDPVFNFPRVERRAVVWNFDGSIVDLNSLLSPTDAENWLLEEALAISDTGWITGLGRFDPDGTGPDFSYDRLFLLQVPEPASTLLFALTGAVLLARRRVD